MGACASTEGVEMGADVTGGGGGGGGVEAPSNWGDPSGPIRMHNVELLKDLSETGGAGESIGGAGFSGGGAAQFLSATPAGGGWLLVALAEVRRLEDTILAYKHGRLVGRLLLQRPEEMAGANNSETKTVAEKLEIKSMERWHYHRLLKTGDYVVVCGGLKRYRAPEQLWYAEGSYRIWVFRASEDDGEREFGRLVHTSELDSWEALKGFTCLRGPRGEVYSVVATTGGAGLAVMRLNMDTFEFDSIMALRVPDDLKRDKLRSVKEDGDGGDDGESAGTNSAGSGGGGGGRGATAMGGGDPFVAAVAITDSHVLWRTWSGADEEFMASRLEDNGRARSAVVSAGPQWRSGRAKRGTGAAAIVGASSFASRAGSVVYCRSIPYERSFAIEVYDLKGDSKRVFGFDIPRSSIDGAVTSCVTADAFSRGATARGAAMAVFCFKVSHTPRRGASDSAISHLLLAVDANREVAACPAVVGTEFRSVRPRGLVGTEDVGTAAAVLDAETSGGRRTCLVLASSHGEQEEEGAGSEIRDVGEEVTETLSLSKRDDEVNFGLEEGAGPKEDFVLSCAVWREAEEGRRWDLWRECPELYLVTFDND